MEAKHVIKIKIFLIKNNIVELKKNVYNIIYYTKNYKGMLHINIYK